jgi:hypothetical protein
MPQTEETIPDAGGMTGTKELFFTTDRTNGGIGVFAGAGFLNTKDTKHTK